MRLLLLFLVAIISCGCESLSPIPLPVEDASDSAFKSDTSEKDPGALFEGTWGGLFADATITYDMPYIPSVWATSWMWKIFNIVSDGDGQLTVASKGCREVYRSSVQETSIISEKKQSKFTFNLRVVSDESGNRIVSDRIYNQYGVNLCDIAGTQLIGSFRETDDSSCEGPCTDAYCDQDGDGKAGITYSASLKLANTEAFQCEVTVSGIDELQLSGTLINEDTIEGALIEPRYQMVVHEADQEYCHMDSIMSESDGCDKHQYFRFVRIADDASCDDVHNMTDCTEQNVDHCDTDDPKPLDPIPVREEDEDCEYE